MRTMRHGLLWPCLLILSIVSAVGVASVGTSPARADTVVDEARRAGRDAASFPAADEDWFHDMDGGVALSPASHQGPQHVDGLDRRQRPLLGRADGDHLRRVRSAEDPVLAPRPEITAATTAGQLSRPGQRALLRQGRPAPTRSVSASGSTCAAPTARRSVRERAEISRRRDRRARQDRAGRLVLRLRHRHPRAAAVPQSRLRRGGGEAWDPERYYTDPELLSIQGPGAAVSRRHVLRLLPCRPEPDAIRRPIPRIPASRTSVPRSARSISGSTGSSIWTADARNFIFQLVHTYRPGRWTPRWSRPTTSTTRAR